VWFFNKERMMADELINIDTEDNLLEDTAKTPADGAETANVPDNKASEKSSDTDAVDSNTVDSNTVDLDDVDDKSSDSETVENLLDLDENLPSAISVEQPDSEEKTGSIELPPLDLDSLDAEIAALQADAMVAEDESSGEDNEDDEEEDPPAAPKSISVELTAAELAALDAEIAAQLDAEDEMGAAGDEWYFVHTYSGMENKVKKNLEHRIESMGMADLILQVVVPTETEVEIRKGVRKEVEKRVFPGYILVNMVVDEDSWYVVRNTPGVTGFVGMGNKPTPLSPDEVSRIMERLDADEPTIKVSFQLGEQVRITGGPFAEFNGIVEEIYADKGKAKVMVSFFNRETPVEVDFVQLEREE